MTFKQGTMIRNSLIWCGLAAAITVSGSALGQDYSNRQIIILVGIAAGGITDVTLAELLAWGKTKPGGLVLGSPGVGTPGHLLAAKIALATNTPIQYIHYRGGAPVMADLVTGRVDFSLASFNSARSNMDAKKLRALAVDAETRLPALP